MVLQKKKKRRVVHQLDKVEHESLELKVKSSGSEEDTGEQKKKKMAVSAGSKKKKAKKTALGVQKGSGARARGHRAGQRKKESTKTIQREKQDSSAVYGKRMSEKKAEDLSGDKKINAEKKKAWAYHGDKEKKSREH